MDVAEADRLKRRSIYLSIAFIAIFVVELALILGGAGFGYVLVVGLVGAGVALADRAYIQAQAREKIFGKSHPR